MRLLYRSAAASGAPADQDPDPPLDTTPPAAPPHPAPPPTAPPVPAEPAAAGAARPRAARLPQVDVMRLLICASVVATHVVSNANPLENVASNGVVNALHYTRQAFFF